MHSLAYFSLLAGLILSLGSGGAAVYAAAAPKGGRASLPWIEKAQMAALLMISLASALLAHALFWKDFSNLYVAEHIDLTLPAFYRLTAFWAGQEGSFLFWTWMIAILGGLAIFSRSYKDMRPETRNLFWLFFLPVQAFFLLILTGPGNPFLVLANPPHDGQGLNPLLQNPGMIFHPPLLFLGYAGFTVPCCLGLASVLTGDTGKARSWVDLAHNWVIPAWIFLTAGIILGAWWSYMELGWGGYWAWDPVENSSLLPWLSGTAYLHTALVTRRRGALPKTTLGILALTLILCFFATYVVRSGVIQSLHAFGDGGVGAPLLAFLIFWIVLAGLGVFADRTPFRRLDGLMTRQGFLVMLTWLLLALALVVFFGTMWPVIGKLFSDKPVGLDAGFYNRVCSPLFALIMTLLFFCPWLGWKGGLERRKAFFAMLVVLVGVGAACVAWGMTMPVPLLAAATAGAFVPGVIALFAGDGPLRARLRSWGAYGVHLGLALLVLGVAFSGPYQSEKEMILKPGENSTLGRYEFIYHNLRETRTPAMIAKGAVVEVKRDGFPYGELTPERRLYARFDQQPFAESDVLPSLGDELYASLIGFTEDNTISLKISVHPLVNWVWIGGTIMCLAGFLVLTRRKSGQTAGSGVSADSGDSSGDGEA